MKIFVCILALAVTAAYGGLLPHHGDSDLQRFVESHLHDAEVRQSHGVHLGQASAIVIDSGVEHPVYHHDGQRATAAIEVHRDAAIDVHHAPAAKIIHHEPIHQVEPVHHVTKVVHHGPHHFLHYTKPEVDHHVVHQDHHIDEHLHAADLHNSELHNDDLLHHHVANHDVHIAAAPVLHSHHHHAARIVDHHHHHHAAATLVHHHLPQYTHAKIVRKVYPAAVHELRTAGDILAFAKHHLHGKYGKVKITEKHY